MAIRFACPSCQQPIEIDDQWAGQSVGCPYCKKVVTAPASSTWPPGDVPVASPAGSAFQAPPPPPGQVQPLGLPSARRSSAPWALTLAITCAMLSLFGWLVWSVSLSILLEKKVGPRPTQQQVAQATQEIMFSGEMPTNPLATAAAVVGALCGMGGLVLAVRSLLRQEPRRGMAIAACIISVCFTCCQGLLLTLPLAARGTTMPAATQPADESADSPGRPLPECAYFAL